MFNFFKLDHMLENEIATPLHTVSVPRTYAIVHFMGLDVFGEPKDNLKLYGHSQKNFYQHKDCFLVWGWSKYTTEINSHIENPETLCLFLWWLILISSNDQYLLLRIMPVLIGIVGSSCLKENLGQMLLLLGWHTMFNNLYFSYLKINTCIQQFVLYSIAHRN